MSMQYGSWKDPNVVRDLKVLAIVGLCVLLAVILPASLVWTVGGLIALAAFAAALMLARASHARSGNEPDIEQPHRGINVSRISLAGFPGFVFAVGFVWMFWSGVPPFRPLIVGIAVVGCLAGVVLIILERRHRVPTETPLGLSDRRTAAEPERGAPPT
jgi:membrane associated rhomboid family serine protease